MLGTKSSLCEVFHELNRWIGDLLKKESYQREQEAEGIYPPHDLSARPIMKSLLSHKPTRYATGKVSGELRQSDSYNVMVVSEKEQQQAGGNGQRIKIQMMVGTPLKCGRMEWYLYLWIDVY